MNIQWAFAWLILPPIGFFIWSMVLVHRLRRGPQYPETFDYARWPKGLYRVLCCLGALCFFPIIYGFLRAWLALFLNLAPLPEGDGLHLYMIFMGLAAFWGITVDGWTNGCIVVRGGGLYTGSLTPAQKRRMIYAATGFGIFLSIVLALACILIK